MKTNEIGNLFITKNGKTYDMVHYNEGRDRPLMPFKYKNTAIDYMNAFIEFIPNIAYETLPDMKKAFAYHVSDDWVNINNSNYKLAKDLKVKNFPWFSKTLVGDVTPYLIQPKPKKELPKVIISGWDYDEGKMTKKCVDAIKKNDTFSIVVLDQPNKYSVTHNNSGYSIKAYPQIKKARELFKAISEDIELVEFFQFNEKEDMDLSNKYMISKLQSMF